MENLHIAILVLVVLVLYYYGALDWILPNKLTSVVVYNKKPVAPEPPKTMDQASAVEVLPISETTYSPTDQV